MENSRHEESIAAHERIHDSYAARKKGRGLIGFGIVIGILGVVIAWWGTAAEMGVGIGTWLFIIVGVVCIIVGYLRRLIAALENR